jgi:hypothetical protein
MQPCGKNYPRAEGQGAKKEVYLPIESWIFTFFHVYFILFSRFYTMLPSMQPLQFEFEVSDFC